MLNLTNIYLQIVNQKNSTRFLNYFLRYTRLVLTLLNNLLRNPGVFFSRKNYIILDRLTSTPLVSVIVPTYNQDKYLKECLDSICRQSYSNYETIVVNDGSSDQTTNILRHYTNQEGIQIITNSRNKGLPESLNIGFKNAHGQVLTWISSDNFVSPQFLEIMVEVLLKNQKSGVIYSNFNIVDSNSRKCERTLGFRNYDRIARAPDVLVMHRFKDVKKVAPINCVGASFLMRREVLELVGGYMEPQGSEDQNFWIKAAEYFMFTKSKKVNGIYFYRIHEESLTNISEKRSYNSLLRTKEKK